MKAILRLLLRLLFRFHAYNEKALQTPGPVLLLPNHVSWLDWLFLGASLDDDWRFVTSSTAAQTTWLHRWIMVNKRTFTVDTNSAYAVKRMAEYLQANGRLVLFAEGRLSTTGSLMKLFDGTGFLLFKTRAKVITCYLRGAHRLPFSPNSNRKKVFPRVTAHYSEVLTPPKLENVSTTQARAKLTAWLREKLVAQQFAVEMAFGPRTVISAIVESARQFPSHIVMADLNEELTYRRLLVGADLLAQQWQRILPAETEHVGVLLPNINATPVILLSLWSAGKVPAMLNFSTGPAIMRACAELAGLKQIITSRAFLERAKLNVAPLIDAGVEMIYLDEIGKNISRLKKLGALLRVTINPRSAIHCAQLPNAGANPAVVLFTSGSEGVPKGVELTQTNLLANIRQMLAMTDLQDSDRVFNCLPLFHSFGLTVGTLLPLVRGMFVFIYPSPLHYRVVPTAFYG